MSEPLPLLGDWVLREPAWLVLAVTVPLASWWRTRAGRPAALLAPLGLLTSRTDGGALARDLVSWRTRLVALPHALHAVALLLVVGALARPAQWTSVPGGAEGLDVVLCVDLSSSMEARDLDAARSRLDVAREEAIAFVRARPRDRVGLVTFARHADVRCLPTLDHEALAGIVADLESVDPEGPEDATGIGAAVARAAEVVASRGARSRVVILLTDGEENVASAATPHEIAPRHAAQLCERLDVRTHAIVVGGDGARAPDTRQVEDLARRTGGSFARARDADALARVVASIDALETGRVERPRRELDDRFELALGGALALALLGRALGASWWQVLP